MTRINAGFLLAWLISLTAVAIMIVSCASTSMTQSASTQSPLPELPLNLGATWTYSDVVYGDIGIQSIITSTYVYTDIVVGVRSMPPYFAAEISRTILLITGEPLYNAPETETWWYVISGTQVYKQPGNALDLSNASSSWLEYVFPLSKRDWYPDQEQRKNLPPDSMFSGKRYTYPEKEVSIPAGQFNSCFLIATVYLSGTTFRWFCPYIGVVAEKYDHGGTPFGNHTVLISYSVRSSP